MVVSHQPIIELFESMGYEYHWHCVPLLIPLLILFQVLAVLCHRYTSQH